MATGFQLLTGLIINKVLAVAVGPAGIAFAGQFVNFKTLATNVASGSFGNGVTKYISDEDFGNQQVIATSNLFTLTASVITGLVIILLREQLSVLLLKDADYSYLFVVFGFLLPLTALNTLLIASVNGFRNYRVLAYLKITNNSIGLILSVALVLSLKLDGALLAYAINSSVVFLVSLLILHYYYSINGLLSFTLRFFDSKLLKKLLAFTLMALTSAQLKPLVQLFIRDYILQNGGEFDAGLWQAMIILSAKYTSIITATLGVYYLPKLSSLTDNEAIRKEILFGMKAMLSLFLVMAVVIFVTRDWIIIILYSREFLGMSHLFFPQLTGDFFMLFSFSISYLLLAKAMTKIFIYSQLFFSATRVVLSIYMFGIYGVEGVIWANAINYIMYSIFVIIIFRKLLFK